MFRSFTALLVAATCLVGTYALAVPRIDSIEPIGLVAGGTTRVKLRGNEFKVGEWQTEIWSSAPGQWVLVEDAENTNFEMFFDVTIPADAAVGPVAVRVWNLKGVSLPSLVLIDSQPGISFTTDSQKPFEHTIQAQQGHPLVCQIWSNQLNKDSDLHLDIKDAAGKLVAAIDDSEVRGSDPFYIFHPPADGRYTAEVHDILWRAKIQGCLQIAPYLDPVAKEGLEQTPATREIDLQKGQYLTITPQTLELDSPAQLVLDLHGPDGKRLVRAGTGDSLLQPLRRRIDQEGSYRLEISDLLGREGLPFQLDISTTQPPFELSVVQKDWWLTETGKSIKTRVQVLRHQYDGEIAISCPGYELENAVIPEKKNNFEITINIPAESERLVVAELSGTAQIGGQTYRAPVIAKDALNKAPLNMIQWPDGVADKVYFLVQSKEGGKDS